MKRLLIQGLFQLPSTGEQQTLVLLPRGFQGYVRAEAITVPAGAGTEVARLMWVDRAGREGRPDGMNKLTTSNFGNHLLCVVGGQPDNQRLWEKPLGGTALIGASTDNNVFVAIDAAGEYPDESD